MTTTDATPNYHGTLSTGVDVITMNRAWESIQVLNRSGGVEIYYTTDGSTPTVGGANCRVLPATICSDSPPIKIDVPVVVQLISSGTPAYSIIGGL